MRGQGRTGANRPATDYAVPGARNARDKYAFELAGIAVHLIVLGYL